MGNLWKGISDEKLINAERELLRHGNHLTDSDFTIQDISLDGDPLSENYIHQITIKPVREGLPKLVMLHGFGGGGAIFIKMLPYLR
jgi:hypothetical protein